MPFGKGGHLGINMVQRGQGGFLFHQIIVDAIADQPGDFFLS